MKGDSTTWIFLRDPNLTENTVVVKFQKESLSSKVFVSLGTWVESSNGNFIFKIFSRQQLIDFNKTVNKMMTLKDMIELKFCIVDYNEDRINVKIFLNDNKVYNEVSSDFFLPFIGKYRMSMAGIGELVSVDNISSKSFPKIVIESDGMFTNEKKNCDCCLIY